MTMESANLKVNKAYIIKHKTTDLLKNHIYFKNEAFRK